MRQWQPHHRCSPVAAGVLPRSGAVADDIPELQPLADRVLVKVEETADVTIGGVVLPDSAKERPLRYIHTMMVVHDVDDELSAGWTSGCAAACAVCARDCCRSLLQQCATMLMSHNRPLWVTSRAVHVQGAHQSVQSACTA